MKHQLTLLTFSFQILGEIQLGHPVHVLDSIQGGRMFALGGGGTELILGQMLWFYRKLSLWSSVYILIYLLYPLAQQSCWGVILVSLRPSVRPASRVRSVAPTVLVDSFHIYTSYQATSEGLLCVKCLVKFLNLNFWQFFKICNFDFVLFWLGIWCE